jgi:hypothetical protein
MLCPCWLGPDTPPDQGWCGGAFIFSISEGSSEGVTLAGCRVAAGFEWPGNFWAGNGTARLYIDAASEEQRRELEAIFGGQKGGPLADVLPAIVTRTLPTQFARIDINWSDRPSISIAGAGSVTLQPVKEQRGLATKVQAAMALTAFGMESMELASSKGSRWFDPDLRSWEGDSGTIHSFDWNG